MLQAHATISPPLYKTVRLLACPVGSTRTQRNPATHQQALIEKLGITLMGIMGIMGILHAAVKTWLLHHIQTGARVSCKLHAMQGSVPRGAGDGATAMKLYRNCDRERLYIAATLCTTPYSLRKETSGVKRIHSRGITP